MRRFNIWWASVFFALLASACDNKIPQESPPKPILSPQVDKFSPAPPINLKTATDADIVAPICADPSVQGAIRNIIVNQGYRDTMEYVRLNFQAFTVEELNTKNHELSCTAQMTAIGDGLAQNIVPKPSMNIDYSVRPALTASDGNYIIMMRGVSGLISALNLEGVQTEIAARQLAAEAQRATQTLRTARR